MKNTFEKLMKIKVINLKDEELSFLIHYIHAKYPNIISSKYNLEFIMLMEEYKRRNPSKTKEKKRINIFGNK